MKTFTNSMIRNLLLSAIILILFFTNANAQIVYTDVSPDVTTSGIYNLDLNNDGVVDFVITHTSVRKKLSCGRPQMTFLFDSMKITPSGTNKVLDFFTSIQPQKLVINTSISNSSLTWNVSANQLLAGYSWRCAPAPGGPGVYYPLNSHNGFWYNSVDGYIGLKFKKNGDTYYGWMRMSISGATTITIKDYAYNSTPGHKIFAGSTSEAYESTVDNIEIVDGSISNTPLQTDYTSSCICHTPGYGCGVLNVYCKMLCGNYCRSLSINESSLSYKSSFINVYPNPASNFVTLQFPSTEESSIQIINLFGQIVYSGKINTEEIQIDLGRFSEGMYIVKWSCGENTETKTFSVIK